MDDMERRHPDSSTTDEISGLGNPSNEDILADTPPSTADEISSLESQCNENVFGYLPPSTTDEILTPGRPSDEHILERYGYVISYDYKNAFSQCVYECVTCEQVSDPPLSRKTTKRRISFEEDPDIDSSKRAKLGDYYDWPMEKDKKGKKIAKYQKGHLAAASNHRYNMKAYHNTFFLSNIVPMCPNVNKIIRKIEIQAQKFARKHGKVYVITGPHFNNNRKPKFVKIDCRVRVPDGIFKVLVHEVKHKRKYFVRAYYIKNLANKTSKKMIKLEDLEKVTGLNLLSNIEGQIQEETDTLKDEWLKSNDILGNTNAETDLKIVSEVDNTNVDDDNRPRRREYRNIGL